jgi:hypothetical protein
MGFESEVEFDLALKSMLFVVISERALRSSSIASRFLSRLTHSATFVIEYSHSLSVSTRLELSSRGIRECSLLLFRVVDRDAVVSFAAGSSSRSRQAANLFSSILRESGVFLSVACGALVRICSDGRIPSVGLMNWDFEGGAGIGQLARNLDLVSLDLRSCEAESTRVECFKGCRNLAVCEFPPGLKRIREDSFSGCDRLRSIDLRRCALLRFLDGGCFERCSNLSGFALPPSVGRIEMRGLSGTSLTSFETAGCAMNLDSGVFDGCIQLRRSLGLLLKHWEMR